MEKVKETPYTFDTQAERDAFLNERFPSRQCSDVPGFYVLADGNGLGVRGLTVTHYEETL